jgi:hypothetical protein
MTGIRIGILLHAGDCGHAAPTQAAAEGYFVMVPLPSTAAIHFLSPSW